MEMALQKQEQILCKALHTDLGKSKTEMMCEIGLVQGEIRWMKQHLGRFADKTCQNTAGAVRCEKLSKPFSLWQCADYEPVELPCSADVRTAGRCHCGRKYCGGKAKCLCTGQCKCPERSVRRMFSTRICCRCFRRTGGKSGTFTGKILIRFFSQEV